MGTIRSVRAKYTLDADAEFDQNVEVVLNTARTTFVSGLLLHSFMRPVDKNDLRNRCVKALSAFPTDVWSKSALHPTLRERLDLALKYQVPV